LARDAQFGGTQAYLRCPIDDYALVVVDEAHRSSMGTRGTPFGSVSNVSRFLRTLCVCRVPVVPAAGLTYL
jgi:type I site-specific restriction endonuclease